MEKLYLDWTKQAAVGNTLSAINFSGFQDKEISKEL